MKIAKRHILISSLLFLSACNNRQDFAYNEKVSSEFLSAMNVLDDYQKDITQGNYKNLNEQIIASRVNTIENIIKGMDENINDSKEIEHSKNADEFAEGLADYYTKQKAYYQLVKNYITQTDSTEQNKIQNQINEAYDSLNTIPDKLLEVQKEFLKKSGIKIAQ